MAAGDAGTAIADSTLFSNPQTLQQWSNLLDSVFGKSTDSTTNTSSTTANASAADNPIMLLVQQLMGKMGNVNDGSIQALLAPIFQQFKEGALPNIQNMANAGGGVYNSTTQKLLQGDALARATAQGGTVMVQQQNELQKQLAALLGILAQSTRQTQQTSNTSQNQRSGGSLGNAGKAALGAGAAAAAAKAIKNLTSPAPTSKDSKGDQEGDYPQFGNYEKDSEGDQPGDYPQVGSPADFGPEFDSTANSSGGNSANDAWDSGNDGGLNWLDNLFGNDSWDSGNDGGFNDAIGNGVGGDTGGDALDNAGGSFNDFGGFGDSSGEDFGESF
jgi:hypothetical protein